ncbi:cytidylyltransferase family-domain-containing protein [Kockiozyma suomiensis]|uniref:cytidylyltransferase family-domain-containing protein n=1 Tax=Kockiozyma suomiensis TaxID=1337062 RepID=UPI0033436AB5
MASTAVESGDERLNLRKNVKKANGSGKLEQNGELKVPGVDGKQDGNGTPSIPLTPRSRSPVGLISYHEKYRYFIHKHEIPRKVLHVSIGFLTLALYLRGIQLSQVTPILVALLAIIVSLDLLRFRSKKFSEYYITGFGFLMRESEVDKWNGIVFYLLGLIIVFILFPKDISVLAVLLLSWSDTAASSFGRAYGHLTPKLFRNKSLAGSFAAFCCGVIASYLLYGIIFPRTPELIANDVLAWRPDTSSLSLTTLCILSGFIGATAEAVDLWGIDDNLTIPVISAIFMWGVVKLFQN